jgi:ABC-type multidrug transport system ATPase subunit
LNSLFPGECFGLLGVNGAGKTTTFRMLTGDERPTTGNGRLLGHDLRGVKREYLRQIGYCPQFDSIIDVLTGRQMLDLFAHIRGIRTAEERNHEIKKWAHFVGESIAAYVHVVKVTEMN